METLLRERYSTSSTGHYNPNYNKYKVHLCRCADDFIVTANSREILIEIREALAEFMSKRGLKLSEGKTVITNIKDGSDFPGWNFRKYKGKLLVPPKESVSKVAGRIKGKSSLILFDRHPEYRKDITDISGQEVIIAKRSVM